MKKHPFFLLEVLIAVILVGSFAYFSIHSVFKSLAKEGKMLKEFTASLEADKERMQIIVDYWKKVKTSQKPVDLKEGYKIKIQDAKDGKHYLLKIQLPGEKEAFCCLVTLS